ncbi:MAG: adenylate/guanylate cyclase domain-containing protein, partial [Candidatus Limnocylindrales bacterium]
PQRDVRHAAAGHLTGPNVDPEATEAGPSKETARLARRVRQLEATLEQAEQIRDTNARLLDRVMADLDAERARSQELLLNILPQPIIDRLNAGEGLIADRCDDVAVVFSDFVGFTEISARLPVGTLVAALNGMFSAFDAACSALGVEKIKTIGDAYMAAAGLPGSGGDHVRAAADLTLAMRSAVEDAGPPWRIRIGLHRGPVVAGVIGTSKYVYDLWGDAVNVASRLEASSEPGRIQVSAPVAEALAGAYVLEARGSIELKGKGSTEAFFLVGRRE